MIVPVKHVENSHIASKTKKKKKLINFKAFKKKTCN